MKTIQVIALDRGQFGGILREKDDVFPVPEGMKLGKWMKLVGATVDVAAPVVASTVVPVSSVPIPADWRSMGAGKRKDLAEKISGKKPHGTHDADAVIEAELEARKPAPFADAPEPETVTRQGNGLQDALGGVDPDWLPPGANQDKSEI